VKIDWQGACAADMDEAAATSVISWGFGASGQLGHRTMDSQIAPRAVTALAGKQVRQLAAGRTHVVAVTKQGHVYSWGSGEQGQLGLGDMRKQSASPYLITALRQYAGVAIVRVACGTSHTLVLASNNEA
jgi:alpha-tubulin suppressor-like RCC1 family protein